MHLPSLAVERLAQPVKGNDQETDRLRKAPPMTPPDGPAPEDAMLLRCERCARHFTLAEGELFLDNFLCDRCYEELARNRGFYVDC